MRDSNFLKENNAKQIWHPMAHPADMRANPPKIITTAKGTHVVDVDGHDLLDAVGGLWNVNLGRTIPASAAPRPPRPSSYRSN
jgi:adenosylmethionine-8-amino-7-oxononanoate aminotransferase